MFDLTVLGQQAKKSARELALMSTTRKNELLALMAQALLDNEENILVANQKDLAQANDNGISTVMQDRLRLTRQRIEEMAVGMRQVIQLADPIGEVEKMWKNPDGLMIGRQKVPLGVIGIIYESRPNVTTDAASLCFKTGNAVILRGGKEAFYSNQILVAILQKTLKSAGVDENAIQFVADTSHEVANQMMRLTQYLDVLIPRGGAGLIRRVKETATVPVIETGTGNNHIYVDKDAQLEMAIRITDNAKTQRPSVCNAAETLLIHQDVAAEFLPKIAEKLAEHNVELHADERAMQYLPDAVAAVEEDWSTEYLDYIMAVKVVDSITEAIAHINFYNTKHSEAIITDNYFASQKFLNEVDAAAVYVNASTRFTDGFVFGFGAEIGISTQKLHARGPMGLEELTSTKYIIYGDGQIRE
ncbi:MULTISPECIES: glutamate-5-semialdehyde dehydrogenase [Enterococcus]|jgi:glutamate-5-semialdehyde dehydrogenase|uniref:Gamma-glutamyl phosphate reductase n=1 Tax=Enterococcus dispar ATCC 51266 TaxID=1139219 RepID=S1NC01_9ENTE|nr:glutamate-5-semialdehyde dehydrogenase [Enterococcus dispar]EOT40170.1 gamma-glutamyl phosphate reductase [Enterococcus dispar ATCC 51266]EOW86547.1 gamma-glutamyl phosphate reductase [Enterococcus dispar ATCC 51266]MDT2705954.1 glutamate-5-semialdehyde dehydrogenase [Enterococcus dispar]OJG39489.1 gamma-glutamyl phosphate reductase [Enterococcus dispar]WCG31981.1 glutamate-5-semialdehyde dehydrogenase [Enterococcus dispar]